MVILQRCKCCRCQPPPYDEIDRIEVDISALESCGYQLSGTFELSLTDNAWEYFFDDVDQSFSIYFTKLYDPQKSFIDINTYGAGANPTALVTCDGYMRLERLCFGATRSKTPRYNLDIPGFFVEQQPEVVCDRGQGNAPAAQGTASFNNGCRLPVTFTLPMTENVSPYNPCDFEITLEEVRIYPKDSDRVWYWGKELGEDDCVDVP